MWQLSELAIGVETESGFIEGRGVKLHYLEFGSGSRPLLAFHGYGQSAREFSVLENSLGSAYRIYSFSLFFHGRSEYSLRRLNKGAIRKKEIESLFRKFLKEKNISRFSLAGYSIGGKFALNLVELFADQLDEVFLFAPDGLRKNHWVRFVTLNRFGRKLYSWFVTHPTLVHKPLYLLNRLGLIDSKLTTFIKNHTGTREQRQNVYRVWMAFRHLEPDLKKIMKLLEVTGIRMHLFFGKYDRIIPPSIGRRFRRLNRKVMLHIIFTGHRLLSTKTSKYLLSHKEYWQPAK